MAKASCHHTHTTIGRIKAIHLAWKCWLGSETLLVAIGRIREPDRAVRMKDHIIRGIEPSSIKAAEHWGRFKGARGGHHHQASGRITTALGAEQDAILPLVVNAAIWHKRLTAWNGLSSPGAIFVSLEQVDEYRCFASYFQSIARHEDVVISGNVDSSLMEQRLAVLKLSFDRGCVA